MMSKCSLFINKQGCTQYPGYKKPKRKSSLQENYSTAISKNPSLHCAIKFAVLKKWCVSH